MGFLAGKKILITGVLSNRSIAYGVAKACQREGATLAFTYVNADLKERVVKIAAEFGTVPVLPCDVTKDDDVAALFDSLRAEWSGLDGLLHAIAFAPREALAGDFLERDFALGVRRCARRELLQPRRARQGRATADAGAKRRRMVTLTYLGALRALPNYNVMGLAKASLEANVRYLASCLGPEGIRVNGISAGPIKTLAAAGIGGFSKIQRFVEANAPMRRNVTAEEVGNVAAFLLSDLASGITGEITYVDNGFSIVAAGLNDD